MRLRSFLLVSFLLGSLSYSPAFAQDTILIFHPTTDNIKTILFLNDSFLETKDNSSFHFLGVYHLDEQYDYEQSKAFLNLDENEDIPFSLFCVEEPLQSVQLYRKNQCTNIFNQLFSSSVGAIFLGGPDLPPGTYNESMHLLTNVTDPERHYMELSALFHFLGSSRNNSYTPLLESNPTYSILGICLGMQTMNVATGGTMIQDIPMEIYGFETAEEVLSNPQKQHRNYNYNSPSDSINLSGYHFHKINIDKSGSFSKIGKGNKPYVLSAHHQCIEKIGKGLIPAAYSEDNKIIEAVVHDKYKNVTGVQFHPEKTGLFIDNDYVFVSEDSTLSYKSFLLQNDSYSFHSDFWKMIEEKFKEQEHWRNRKD